MTTLYVAKPDTLLLEELAAIADFADDMALAQDIDVAFSNLLSGADYNRVRLGCLHKVPANLTYSEIFTALPYGQRPRCIMA
jgi:hypothetical protein